MADSRRNVVSIAGACRCFDWLSPVIVARVCGAAAVLAAAWFLASFAVGAAIAAALAGPGWGLCPPRASFVVASMLVLFAVRPLVMVRGRVPARIRTGGAALIGARAVVLERVANDHRGAVRIGGEVSTARLRPGGHRGNSR
jgi:membrane protein implicated in regulation of membrane protease activity